MAGKPLRLVQPGASQSAATAIAEAKHWLRRPDVVAVATVVVTTSGQMAITLGGERDDFRLWSKLRAGVCVAARRLDDVEREEL